MKLLSRTRRLLPVVLAALLVLTTLPAWGMWPGSATGGARSPRAGACSHLWPSGLLAADRQELRAGPPRAS